jgi:hypothetical protein
VGFEFEADANRLPRMHRYFIAVSVDWPTGYDSLWWHHEIRRWLPTTEGGGCSNQADCRTFKAFKRHLRRHAAALKGRKVTLVSRFVGYDITVQL